MVRIDVIAFSPTEVVEEFDVNLSKCIELLGKYPTTWINIVGLDKENMELLENLFGFHHLALEDCINPVQRPKVEDYEGHHFIVARTIAWEEEIRTDQLSLFLGKKYIVTVHDRPLPQLEDVKSRIRKKSPRILKGGPDYLCFMILDTIVDSYFPEIDRIGEIIEKLEERVLKGPAKETVDTIHQLRTDLLLLRRELYPQRESLALLARGDSPYFKKDTVNYLRDVYDHSVRVLDSLETYRELTGGLLEIYLSMQQVQLNEVIKVLTILFTVTIPATLIGTLFGQNFEFPLEGSLEGFLLSSSVIIAATVAVIGYLRWKKLI